MGKIQEVKYDFKEKGMIRLFTFPSNGEIEKKFLVLDNSEFIELPASKKINKVVPINEKYLVFTVDNILYRVSPGGDIKTYEFDCDRINFSQQPKDKKNILIVEEITYKDSLKSEVKTKEKEIFDIEKFSSCSEKFRRLQFDDDLKENERRFVCVRENNGNYVIIKGIVDLNGRIESFEVLTSDESVEISLEHGESFDRIVDKEIMTSSIKHVETKYALFDNSTNERISDLFDGIERRDGYYQFETRIMESETNIIGMLDNRGQIAPWGYNQNTHAFVSIPVTTENNISVIKTDELSLDKSPVHSINPDYNKILEKLNRQFILGNTTKNPVKRYQK